MPSIIAARKRREETAHCVRRASNQLRQVMCYVGKLTKKYEKLNNLRLIRLVCVQIIKYTLNSPAAGVGEPICEFAIITVK